MKTCIYLTTLLVATGACATTQSLEPPTAAASHLDARQYGRYRAVLVGNRDYQNFRNLEAASNDIDELKRVLENDYKFSVTVLLNATAMDLQATLDELSRSLTEYDSLLFYFSGHGETSAGEGPGYWLPIDADAISRETRQADPERAELRAHWISRGFVANSLDAMRAVHVLVVDDSCYSPTSWREKPRAFAEGSKQRELDPEKLASRRTRKWLSAGGNEPVIAGDSIRSTSYFTGHLARALHENPGVTDGNGLFGVIRDRMVSGPQPQIPTYESFGRNEGGDALLIKSTWSVDEIHFGEDRVVVRVLKSSNVRNSQTSEQIKKLVIGELQRLGGPSSHVNERLRRFLLIVSYPGENKISLTLIDRESDQVLGNVDQVLAGDYQQLATNVASAVSTLRTQADYQLSSKEISVDTVERALVSQLRRDWEIALTVGASAYVDFEGIGLLNQPALALQVVGSRTLLPWLLVGLTFGFDTSNPDSHERIYFVDSGAMRTARNRIRGQLAMHSESALVSVMVRQSYGLVLPFLYLQGGIAHHAVDFSDENYEPVARDEEVPGSIHVVREDASSWGLALAAGVGVNFLMSEHWALVARAHLFKNFHGMKVEKIDNGIEALRNKESTPFQAIQGVSAHVGASWMF